MNDRVKKVIAFCMVPWQQVPIAILALRTSWWHHVQQEDLVIMQQRSKTLNPSICWSHSARSAKCIWQWATSDSQCPHMSVQSNLPCANYSKGTWGAVAFATCPESFTKTQPPKRLRSRCLLTSAPEPSKIINVCLFIFANPCLSVHIVHA